MGSEERTALAIVRVRDQFKVIHNPIDHYFVVVDGEDLEYEELRVAILDSLDEFRCLSN